MADVLVAGAGPTGLALALWLARLRVGVRIVDQALAPGTTSRALAVQARTLELYRPLGLAQTLVDEGIVFTAVNLWVRGRRRGRAPVGSAGRGLSPFPFVLIHPQDAHERALAERLAREGVEVERGTALVGAEQDGGAVRARLRRRDGAEETAEAAFLAGCDGAHSAVREAIRAGFPGGTYAHTFYVADVEAAGGTVDGELHVSFDGPDFIAVFPMRGTGRVRLVGAIRERAPRQGAPAPEPSWEDVDQRALSTLRLDVRRVNWFSTYRVHHRVADRFRAGRVFLLGDAAHIHSPVGGQGMNTGIGDAANLAWKLAMVLGGEADDGVLDSYERERAAFARKLVATTDRVFQLASRPGSLADGIRDVAPVLVSTAFRLSATRRWIFRLVSQLGIEYRSGGLAEGRAGAIHGGDRLPWVEPEAGEPDNFVPLASLRWQVHVYGAAAAGLLRACAARGLPLHARPYDASARRAGLARDALYLVRPDGYVALADPAASPARLAAFLDAHGLHLRPPTGVTAAPARDPPAPPPPA